nr:immunoglobulin light chain junction region [Macaca mulatta]
CLLYFSGGARVF